MKTISARLDILPEAQRALWPHLAPLKDLGFCLYGGTALALYLGHRPSVDFDFFTENTVDDSMGSTISDLVPEIGEGEIVQKSINTRTYRTLSGVRVSFFGQINFGRVGIPSITSDNCLILASLEDLFATKLAVILQRIEYKDYKDIVSLLQYGFDIMDGLAYAKAIYGKQIPLVDCIKALVYFEGGDLDLLSDEDKRVLLTAVKNVHLQQIPDVKIRSFSLTGKEAFQRPWREDMER